MRASTVASKAISNRPYSAISPLAIQRVSDAELRSLVAAVAPDPPYLHPRFGGGQL